MNNFFYTERFHLLLLTNSKVSPFLNRTLRLLGMKKKSEIYKKISIFTTESDSHNMKTQIKRKICI